MAGHSTKVNRIPGSHYVAICETCGLIGRTKTSKGMLEGKAAEHQRTGINTFQSKGTETSRTSYANPPIANVPKSSRGSQPARKAVAHGSSASNADSEEVEVFNDRTHGHAYERLNICALGDHPLYDSARTYRQKVVEGKIISICNNCFSDLAAQVAAAGKA